jgi:hypothetical protein
MEAEWVLSQANWSEESSEGSEKSDCKSEAGSPIRRLRESINEYYEQEKNSSGKENMINSDNKENIEKDSKGMKGATNNNGFSIKLTNIKSQFMKYKPYRPTHRQKDGQRYKKKHILSLWVLPFYFEKLVGISLLLNINSILHVLFILPIRMLWGWLKLASIWWHRNERLIFDMYYYSIILIVTFTFMYTSDTSSLYHWIKGKSFVKLYSFFVILDISDLLSRSIGKDLIYSLSRNIHYKETAFRVSLLLWIYGILHSFVLIFQLLTLNSIFKSSRDTFLLFLLSNNVAEIKVYVFKRIDKKILYDFTCRDTNERAQQLIYFIYIIILNNRYYATDGQNLIHRILMMFFAEFLVDWLKHFLLNTFYTIHPSIYLNYRYLLLKLYLDSQYRMKVREGIIEGKLDAEENEDILTDLETEIQLPSDPNKIDSNTAFLKDCNEVKNAVLSDTSQELMLMRNNLNELYLTSIFQNFMIIPQAALIIRLTIDFLHNNEFHLSEIFMFLFLLVILGAILEKLVSSLLNWSANRIVNKEYFT